MTDDKNMIDDWTNDIHTGDAVDTLAELPESSVHMVMTSPPYFGLRDYGVDGQIGLEESLDEYITELVGVFREVRRVLRPDGSAWLNLGDSYDGGKNKMLVPHRVAIALQDDEWIVRNDVTWAKPNPMPSSVKDRLNTTTEQVFHLVPEPEYWYDLDAIREPHAEGTVRNAKKDGYEPFNHEKAKENKQRGDRNDGGQQVEYSDKVDLAAGKNPGDVFEVTTKPFPEAHFAVYPPELVEKPLKATCPPTVCAECGSPYIRESVNAGVLTNPTGREQKQRAIELFEQSDLTREHLSALRSIGFTDAGQAQEVYDGHGRNADDVEQRAAEAKDVLGGYAREFIGPETESTEWVQGCDCDTDATEPGVALDPFAGAGTTALVAKDHGRRFVGIDLNPEYVAMAQKRLGLDVHDPSLVREEAEAGLDDFA